MKGFSAQADAAFSTAASGADISQIEGCVEQCNGSAGSSAAQPDAPIEPAASTRARPSAQPGSANPASRAEHGIEVDAQALVVSQDCSPDQPANSPGSDGRSAADSQCNGDIRNGNGLASPFMRHIEQLAADREQPERRDGPAAVSESADGAAASSDSADVQHNVGGLGAAKATEGVGTGPCGAAKCRCNASQALTPSADAGAEERGVAAAPQAADASAPVCEGAQGGWSNTASSKTAMSARVLIRIALQP